MDSSMKLWPIPQELEMETGITAVRSILISMGAAVTATAIMAPLEVLILLILCALEKTMSSKMGSLTNSGRLTLTRNATTTLRST